MIKDYKDFSGVILAGGRSSRMGFPKAFLSLKGKKLIDIILEVFYSFFNEIFIVTDDKNRFLEFKDVSIIEDLIKGRGPLGGIYTGLRTISKDKAFFIACDMPLLHKDLIKRLLSTSIANDYDCVVPYTPEGIEPLHAVYSIKILRIIENLLKEKDLSVNRLLKRCKCKYIKVDSQEASSFFNVNTPEELKKLPSMDKNGPFILSIIGKPDSGKTTLILNLLPELKRRGYKVAVAKHCPRGFDLDIEGKDSYRFSQAGGEGIFLSSDERIAILRPRGGLSNIKERLQNYFSDFDIVLMEGYNNESGIKRMRIIRSAIEGMDSSSHEIIAYISDMSFDTDKPVYKPDDIPGIISFINTQIGG